ncbi:hypothetical protein [Bacillus benzoevorans]|uniref:hypothetical protein n=1 Tax=Bacillus benzoevorans TaxID=1456 RepID=UPI0031B640B9
MLKLYFINECLGEVQNINIDGVWVNGKIKPNKNLGKFIDFFEGVIEEESKFVAENFNTAWLDDRNWFIVDGDNKKKEIHLPAVYPDGDINWKWRA